MALNAIKWKPIAKLPKGRRKGVNYIFRFAPEKNPARAYMDLPVAYQVNDRWMGSRVCTHYAEFMEIDESQLWRDTVSAVDEKLKRGRDG